MYRVIGRTNTPTIRNANPKELPRGDDGIDTEREWVVQDFDFKQDAQDFIRHQCTSCGELGGSFGHILVSEYYTPLELYEYDDETKVTKLKLLTEYLAQKVKQ